MRKLSTWVTGPRQHISHVEQGDRPEKTGGIPPLVQDSRSQNDFFRRGEGARIVMLIGWFS